MTSKRTSLPSLGSMSIAEAKAKVADFEKIAAKAVPSESVRLRAAAKDLRAAIELREKSTAKATAPATKPQTDLTPELEKAFAKMGHDPVASRIAAAGRRGRPVAAASLTEAGRGLGLSPAAARQFARGRFAEAVVKNVAGLTAACFAYCPELESPETWKLQICRAEDPGRGWQPDADLVKAAVNSLPGLAPYGAEIAIPASALPGVKSTLRAAWIACSLPLDDPSFAVLNQEALRQVFRKGLGLSEQQATIAARGRGRRS